MKKNLRLCGVAENRWLLISVKDKFFICKNYLKKQNSDIEHILEMTKTKKKINKTGACGGRSWDRIQTEGGGSIGRWGRKIVSHVMGGFYQSRFLQKCCLWIEI